MFSLSWDLGDVDDNAKEAVWAMGLARSPVVQYTSGSNSEGRYPYYLTEYSNADDAVRKQGTETFDSRLTWRRSSRPSSPTTMMLQLARTHSMQRS